MKLDGATRMLAFVIVTLSPQRGSAVDEPGDNKASVVPDLAKPGEGGYVLGELIYSLDDKPTPQCHASTIAETRSGLVAAWFGGQHERNSDVGIWVSRHEGATWSKPVVAAG